MARRLKPLVSLSAARLPNVAGAKLPLDFASKELLALRVQEAKMYEVPIYLKTKAEIIEHYQAQYGADSRGRDGWKANLIRDLQAQGMGYDAARKSLQPSRINQQGGRSPYWEKLGQTLPPRGIEEKQHDLTGKRATVNFSIHFKISERYKNAQKTVLLTQERTQRLMRGNFRAVLEQYGLPTGNISEMEIRDLDIQI